MIIAMIILVMMIVVTYRHANYLINKNKILEKMNEINDILMSILIEEHKHRTVDPVKLYNFKKNIKETITYVNDTMNNDDTGKFLDLLTVVLDRIEKIK